jgi:hypothetical protein
VNRYNGACVNVCPRTGLLMLHESGRRTFQNWHRVTNLDRQPGVL